MDTLQTKIDDFLSSARIAVAGVSRTQQDAANLIYKKLRESGYQVFPVNPNADVVEGDACYPSVAAIPDGVDAVVISTSPQVTEQLVKDCAAAGVLLVWMHRSLVTAGSVSEQAVQYCQENGIEVIAGACPMMYVQPVDFGHKCMRWLMSFSGGLPD